MLMTYWSEENAINPIKNVRAMFAEGGFNLTKFVSNNKGVAFKYIAIPSMEIVVATLSVKVSSLLSKED